MNHSATQSKYRTRDENALTKCVANVTQDDIDKVLDKVNEAVSKGDGTLAGDAGKDVVNKVTDNASKAPAADREKVEEKKDAVTDSAVKAEGKKTDAARPSTGSGSAPSKSDSKPSSGSSGKPSHEHTWQAQYRNDPVYETRTRTVVDQDAWDEQVLSGSHYQFSDGYVTSDGADAWAHQKRFMQVIPLLTTIQPSTMRLCRIRRHIRCRPEPSRSSPATAAPAAVPRNKFEADRWTGLRLPMSYDVLLRFGFAGESDFGAWLKTLSDCAGMKSDIGDTASVITLVACASALGGAKYRSVQV